jgi:predicted DCC family thiol-disulfide oxidoreductase YuxK
MLIYDGDCGFCTSSAQWIEKRLPLGYPVVAWQSVDDLGALGLDEAQVRRAAWWIGTDGTLHAGARAIARSLVACRGPWSVLGWALLVPPVSWLATIAYALIARYRYRLPGKAACTITPPSEDRLVS